MNLTYNVNKDISIEIPVPSFWKTQYGFYRLYESENEIWCDAFFNYDSIDQVHFLINYGIKQFLSDYSKAEQISKEYYLNALLGFVDRISDILESLNEDMESFPRLSVIRYPLNEP